MLTIIRIGGNEIVSVTRLDNCYCINRVDDAKEAVCNKVVNETSVLWHQRLGHVNYRELQKLSKRELVSGLSKLDKTDQHVCEGSQLGKRVRVSHKKVKHIQTKVCLELVHMDPVDLIQTLSLDGKKYILVVVVDDFSRFTWVSFLREKSETFQRSGTKQTPSELRKGKKPNVSYFRIFGNTCYISRDREHLSKFDSKSDKGIFLGYSTSSRDYRVYNYRTGTIIGSTNVSIDDFAPSTKMASYEDGLLSPMSVEESPGLNLVVDLSTFSKPVDL
ncbi:hypothetical protein L3X38_041740 [Prunus dulcis]|uniref:GAG-pre-integrase domain-containing protein n=1 Tax=Prunus dulcis TaxID=3755 RepID=A0AAD4UV89_PRUDU|nr:hypothetical protein L3X38_041740 [Prunus dulcis]